MTTSLPDLTSAHIEFGPGAPCGIGRAGDRMSRDQRGIPPGIVGLADDFVARRESAMLPNELLRLARRRREQLRILHLDLRLPRGMDRQETGAVRWKSWHAPCTRRLDANAMDDITLARALLVREGWAPAEAWARFVPMVRGIVVRGLGRDSEIDDVIQEIFYRMFAKIGTLEKPEALRQFVASFALRVVKWEHGTCQRE